MNQTALLLALLPLIVLAAGTVIVMLAAAFHSGQAAWVASVLVLLASCAALPGAASVAPFQFTPLLRIDHYALYYMGLVLAATLVVAVLCRGYFNGREGRHGALYILLLLAALGGAVLAASTHFASFLLGLEVYSVALFALIAYRQNLERPLEAGVKYLVLAGLSSALLLFGMALIYARLGTMQFSGIGTLLAAMDYQLDGMLLAGFALILAGVGFKLALVPFHMWIPDVYEGAPAPIAALVATVSKAALIALLLRYFIATQAYRAPSIMLAVSLAAIASILAGNLLALLQNNVKRILAYSSIAHVGYLLVAFLAAGSPDAGNASGLAVEAVGYYLAAYFVSMLGAFGVVTLLSDGSADADCEMLADYRGLLWRAPWLAAAFAAMLLSLAGIPLTMGFVGKFYVAAAGVGAALWLLVTVLVIGSVIGLFYTLRIIAVMCAPLAKQAAPPTASRRFAVAGYSTLAALVFLLVWLGVFPAPLIQVIDKTIHRVPGAVAQGARLLPLPAFHIVTPARHSCVTTPCWMANLMRLEKLPTPKFRISRLR